jgi:hypothetical protein
MNKEMTSQAEADEQILTSDVPDDVLERAASTEQNALTMLYALPTGTAAVCRRL